MNKKPEKSSIRFAKHSGRCIVWRYRPVYSSVNDAQLGYERSIVSVLPFIGARHLVRLQEAGKRGWNDHIRGDDWLAIEHPNGLEEDCVGGDFDPSWVGIDIRTFYLRFDYVDEQGEFIEPRNGYSFECDRFGMIVENRWVGPVLSRCLKGSGKGVRPVGRPYVSASRPDDNTGDDGFACDYMEYEQVWRDLEENGYRQEALGLESYLYGSPHQDRFTLDPEQVRERRHSRFNDLADEHRALQAVSHRFGIRSIASQNVDEDCKPQLRPVIIQQPIAASVGDLDDIPF